MSDQPTQPLPNAGDLPTAPLAPVTMPPSGTRPPGKRTWLWVVIAALATGLLAVIITGLVLGRGDVVPTPSPSISTPLVTPSASTQPSDDAESDQPAPPSEEPAPVPTVGPTTQPTEEPVPTEAPTS